jgi:Tol biopolymer transport system component
MAVQRVELSAIVSAIPGRESESRRLTAENQNSNGALGLAWTPDGRIVYASRSEQRVEITVIGSDGSNPRQILAGSANSSISDLAVSPRGDLLAISLWFEGDRANLWLIDMKDGHEKKLTNGQQDFPPSFTPDGQWIVYGSVQGDKPVLMKIPAQGGTPLQITNYPADSPAVSPDGQWIACSYVPQPDRSPLLAILPIAGGPPVRTFPLPETAKTSHMAWTPGGTGVSFVNDVNDVSNIWQQPIAGGPALQMTHFTSGKILDFQWSRDGRLALSRGTELTDVVALRNFH